MHPLDTSADWAHRVARAERLLGELEVLVSVFMAADPFTLEVIAKDRVVTVRGRIDESAPIEFSLRTGEVLYHLRAALDHVACAAVSATGAAVTPRTEFPIFVEPDRFESAGVAKLRGSSEGVIDAVRAVQPFGSAQPITDPLWMLHELARADRHRNLHLVAATMGQLRLAAITKEGATVTIATTSQRASLGRFEDGEDVAQMIVAASLDPTWAPRAAARLVLALEYSPLGTLELIPTLRGIAAHVALRVLPRIADRIDPRTSTLDDRT